MRNFSLFFFSISFFLLISLQTGISQTIIPGGYVSGTWIAANSPFQINGDITIHADSTLTIEPGVEVIFQGHYRFIINGIINAVGTPTDSIRFTAAIPDTGWRGLRFMTSADTSRLAYCIIEYGKATGGGVYDKRGGGIYCNNSLPEISHCSIRNNLAAHYGGGICFYNVSNDSIFLTDCNITNNRTTWTPGHGAGIYFNGEDFFVEMQNCIVSHNVSTNGNGGGIYIGYSTNANTNVLSLSNCNVTYNQAVNEGGGICFYNVSNDSIFLTDCNITNNRTTGFSGYGGGIYFKGDDLFVGMQNCIVSHNVSTNGNGGGICFDDITGQPTLSLTNCQITYNQSDDEGGGIWIQDYSFYALDIINSDISYNLAVNNGGGIYAVATLGGNHGVVNIFSSTLVGNEVTGALGKGGAFYGDPGLFSPYSNFQHTTIAYNQAFEGGGLYLKRSWNLKFDHCTFANNTATNGSGLFIDSSSGAVNIKNSIFSLNNPAGIHNGGNIAYLGYSDFYGNGINISGGVPAGFGQLVTTNYNGDSCDVGYNIFLDPLFEDPGSGNYQITWTNWPTPDSTKSPCIDAGDPLSPFDPDGTITDMGVFSFDQTIPVELVSFTAEFNKNNVVLKWITATETNNRGFEIQRKPDKADWEKIGFVEGHGTTTEPSTYSYSDDISNINAKSLAYRLKQIDFNGSHKYSNEVSVEISTPLYFALYQNYPNPFNPSTKIKYSIPFVETHRDASLLVTLKVFDILGNDIETLVNEEKAAGAYEITWYAGNLPSGVYFYQLKAGNFTETKKMLMLK